MKLTVLARAANAVDRRGLLLLGRLLHFLKSAVVKAESETEDVP